MKSVTFEISHMKPNNEASLSVQLEITYTVELGTIIAETALDSDRMVDDRFILFDYSYTGGL